MIYPIRRDMAGAFSDDPNILNETVIFLQTLLPTLPFFGLFMVAMSTGRGSGHTLFPTTVGITRLWGIRLILGYFLAFTFGMGSLRAWLAISLSNVVGRIVSIVWVVYGNWLNPLSKKSLRYESMMILYKAQVKLGP